MTATENFEATWKDVEEKFKGRVDVTSSKDNYLELMEPGVNKWQAVKSLAESFGIKPEEIMCIGDSNNDLSMIKKRRYWCSCCQCQAAGAEICQNGYGKQR